MKTQNLLILLFLHGFLLIPFNKTSAQTWTSDNGNGTFTNPLFFEEFSDPCMVRVGDDYYLTGTTNHCMPGLPILHSKDLVNWRLTSYLFNRFNLGPEFSFQDGKDMYGHGIWAPSFSYKNGTFYLFANVNGHTTQVYHTQNINGPWTHHEMKCNLHDLSVFFDDDGKVYASWGAYTIHLAELNKELTDTVPGTSRVIARNVGEGSHIYKINGKYIITWAIPGASVPMLCGKSDHIYGPYEVVRISDNDHMSVGQGHTWIDSPFTNNRPFRAAEPEPKVGFTLHQGGIIQTQTGEWWGYSMQDHNSLGRVLNLAPITWENGFPYFGLPGNLTKSPRTWVKPNVGLPAQPIVSMIDRNDDFSGDSLGFQWQWNHFPDDSKWSLSEKKGVLRMHSLPSKDFFHARNTLTQRAIGPVSTTTVEADMSGLQKGDVAGLALLNYPYAWLGVSKTPQGYVLKMFDYTKNNELTSSPIPEVLLNSPKMYLRVHTDYDTEKAQFSYSLNGKKFINLGDEFLMVYQMRTFQGVRTCLFNFNQEGANGGYADFDNFRVDELYPKGFRRPIPYSKEVLLINKGTHSPLVIDGTRRFKVTDLGLGRVALNRHKGNEYLAVTPDGKVVWKTGKPGKDGTFQWIEQERGDLALLSLVTNRYLTEEGGLLHARRDIPSPTRKDGSSFIWSEKDTLPVTYQNPVVGYSLPDPSLLLDKDGYFYLYATEDIRNLPIHRSKDLVHWELVGTAFTEESRPSFEPRGGIWAPDINKIGNNYVLYYSMSVWGGEQTCGIGVAVADRPQGPFKDQGKMFRSHEIGVQNSIDPFYIEDKGKKYLFWGSFRGIYCIELSQDGLSIKEGAKKQQIAGTAYEGVYIHKKGGYYYLFASIGSCCEGLKSTYTTVVGRSKSLFGPYLDKNGASMMDNHHEILIQKNDRFVGTGHNSEIVTDKAGNSWILYHACDKKNPHGRMLLMDQVNWIDGWPQVKGNSPSQVHLAPQF